MKVFMIGGTGLLGSEAARELIRRGHTVLSMALPPLPAGAPLPPEMEIELGNYMETTDENLAGRLRGCEGLVFAAGVDERVEGPAPIYEFFKKYNITPLERLLRLAKQSGVKHAVICGSYFSYFEKLWPEKELSKWHPYIRSRRDQEQRALAFAGPDFDVSILELPYIFGTQPGRKPVWVFLVEKIRAMKWATLYPGGGSTMVTVKQVGQAIAGALERGRGGACYPIGYYNLTWAEMLTIFHKYMGCPKKKIITIPDWLFALVARGIRRKQRAAGIEGGLDAVKYTALQCENLFIDMSLGCVPLGVERDDLDAAIGESIRLSLAVLDGKAATVGMKGE
jgi:dihydroflavonol-4-reductase